MVDDFGLEDLRLLLLVLVALVARERARRQARSRVAADEKEARSNFVGLEQIAVPHGRAVHAACPFHGKARARAAERLRVARLERRDAVPRNLSQAVGPREDLAIGPDHAHEILSLEADIRVDEEDVRSGGA